LTFSTPHEEWDQWSGHGYVDGVINSCDKGFEDELSGTCQKFENGSRLKRGWQID